MKKNFKIEIIIMKKLEKKLIAFVDCHNYDPRLVQATLSFNDKKEITTEEALLIVSTMRKYYDYAKIFFFLALENLVKYLCYIYNCQRYGFKKEDVSQILLSNFWETKFTRLNSFNPDKHKLHSTLSLACSQILWEHLKNIDNTVKEPIDKKKLRHPRNPNWWSFVISYLTEDISIEILKSIYVEKKSKDEVSKEMKLSNKEFRLALSKAESDLYNALSQKQSVMYTLVDMEGKKKKNINLVMKFCGKVSKVKIDHPDDQSSDDENGCSNNRDLWAGIVHQHYHEIEYERNPFYLLEDIQVPPKYRETVRLYYDMGMKYNDIEKELCIKPSYDKEGNRKSQVNSICKRCCMHMREYAQLLESMRILVNEAMSTVLVFARGNHPMSPLIKNGCSTQNELSILFKNTAKFFPGHKMNFEAIIKDLSHYGVLKIEQEKKNSTEQTMKQEVTLYHDFINSKMDKMRWFFNPCLHGQDIENYNQTIACIGMFIIISLVWSFHEPTNKKDKGKVKSKAKVSIK